MLMAFRDLLHRSRNLGALSSFECGSPIEQRILAARLEEEPYPYFVADEVLPAESIAAMRANWPARSDFTPEIPHNYVCDLLRNRVEDRAKRSYWDNFVQDRGVELARATAKKFAPWISALYGADIDVQFANVSLMESDPAYAGHGCHTHHYHDPCWVGTILFYLDGAPNGYPGTTINRFQLGGVDEEARMAAKTLQWIGETKLEEFKTVEYLPNRLFGMFDSPISYHSVKAASPNAIGNRRVFRVHLTAPNSQIKSRYNVSPAQYRAMRKLPTTEPTVIEWLRRDVEQMRSAAAAKA